MKKLINFKRKSVYIFSNTESKFWIKSLLYRISIIIVLLLTPIIIPCSFFINTNVIDNIKSLKVFIDDFIGEHVMVKR